MKSKYIDQISVLKLLVTLFLHIYSHLL